MGLTDILSKISDNVLKTKLQTIAQNDGGVDKSEIDSAKGFLELQNLLNGCNSKTNDYELMTGLIVEYQSSGDIDDGKLESPKVIDDKSTNDYIKNGYQFVDEAYINIGNSECCFKVTLYSKPGQPLFYELSTYSTDRDGKATTAEIQRMSQYLKDNYGIDENEFLQQIQYNAFSKSFSVNMDKITGNDVVNTDLLKDNEISIYNKNDKEAVKVYNEIINSPDEETLREALSKINSPEIYKKIEHLLGENPKYNADNLYSPLEKLIYNKASDSSSFNYSSPNLETMVTNLIQSGALSEDDAIKAQARLAARLIFDGCDGFGTHEDVVDKGVHMIKSPIYTGNSEQNSKNALRVLEEVNNIVKKQRTFYGYGKTFEDLEKYLSDDLTKGQIDYVNMIQKINGLQNSELQPSDLENILQKYSSDPSKAAQAAIIQDMLEGHLAAIEDLYNSGIEHGGIFADMADGVSGLWNADHHPYRYSEDTGDFVPDRTVIIESHGNKASLVKRDMVTNYDNIVRLTKALDAGNFEEEFRDIFKTDYNKDNVKKFLESKNKYAVALYGKSTIENLQKQKEFLDKCHDDTAVIGVIVDILGIEPEMQKEIEIKSKKENIPLVYVYKRMFTKFIEKASEGYNKLLDGKKLEDLENDKEEARKTAFGNGPYSNIVKRVEDYNVSQLEGAEVCKISAEIAMVLGAMVLTGGMTAPAGASMITRVLTKEGVRYGIASGTSHFIAEMGNKASTYEGNTWEHTRITLTESIAEAVITSWSETKVKKLLDNGFAHILTEKFGKEKIVAICSKCLSTATRNFLMEETKQFALTGSLNNEKSGIKALYAAIAKAIFPGKGKVSKYLIEKGSRKMATNVTYNEFCKEFNIEKLKQQNPEVKALMEAISEEEFVALVNGIIDDIRLEAEKFQEIDLRDTFEHPYSLQMQEPKTSMFNIY